MGYLQTCTIASYHSIGRPESQSLDHVHDHLKYDDASWHSGGEFPKDLPDEAGATHTGMFVAWALLSGLAGDLHTHDSPNELAELESRSITPGAFFLEACDGKFTDEDLNEAGNAFAQTYFVFETGPYLADYEATLGHGLPDLYYVEDSWENFDRLKPVLDRRYHEWRSAHAPVRRPRWLAILAKWLFPRGD
jgi:hypothetical protein